MTSRGRLRRDSQSSVPTGRRSARSLPLESDLVLGTGDASLLDIVDNVLAKGVVLSGDVTLALAQVDLIYLRLSLMLCAADRLLPNEDPAFEARHDRRDRFRRSARKRPGR